MRTNKFDEPARLFEIQLRDGRPLNYRSDDVTVALEYADCLVEMQRIAEAESIFQSIDSKAGAALEADDEVVFWRQYADLAQRLGVRVDADWGARLAAAIDRYEARRAAAIEAVHSLSTLLTEI
jgi:hypothetical protein